MLRLGMTKPPPHPRTGECGGDERGGQAVGGVTGAAGAAGGAGFGALAGAR